MQLSCKLIYNFIICNNIALNWLTKYICIYMCVLRIKNLLYSYDSRSSFTFPDIELKSGENLLILGESGIGKTTFLHLIAGLLSPNSGTIELMGTVLNRLSSRKLDQFRGRHIGLVFQRPHFINAISCR